MGISRHSQHHSSIPSGFSGRHETRVAGLTLEEVQLARVRLDLRGWRDPRTAAFGTEGPRGGCRWQIGQPGRIDRTLLRGGTPIRTLTAVGEPFLGKGHGRSKSKIRPSLPVEPASAGRGNCGDQLRRGLAVARPRRCARGGGGFSQPLRSNSRRADSGGAMSARALLIVLLVAQPFRSARRRRPGAMPGARSLTYCGNCRRRTSKSSSAPSACHRHSVSSRNREARIPATSPSRSSNLTVSRSSKDPAAPSSSSPGRPGGKRRGSRRLRSNNRLSLRCRLPRPTPCALPSTSRSPTGQPRVG